MGAIESIPVIDLGASRGTKTARQAIADTIGQACREVGFFSIANHGVSSELISQFWQTTSDFFDLPQAQKDQAQAPFVGYPYGYAPYAKEALALSLGNEAPPDLKESFSMGPIQRPDPQPCDPDAAFAYAPTIWPPSQPQMAEIWADYYNEMAALAARLMALFALALELKEDYFAASIDQHVSAIRANHYPAQDQPPLPGQLRAGAHTDYGSLTILRRDQAPGGLQVATKAGTWLDVPHIPDSFVINIGDLLAQWTNNRWCSTLHRVVNPQAVSTTATRRLSVAFFHNPNWDAEITCLPSCLASGEAPRHAPVLAGPHLMQKYHKTQAVAGQKVENGLY